MLSYCSIGDWPGILVWMSVQSNAFIVLGWFALALPSLLLGSRATVFWMAWSLISLALALTPLFMLGMKELLVGYYLWVLAIGMLTVWFWRFGK